MAGRLGDPNIVVELLTSYETKIKDQIIDKLILLNNKRKIIEYDILKKINLNKLNIDKRSIMIIENTSFNEGIIGIIAGYLKTYFGKPVVVITKSSNIYKGQQDQLIIFYWNIYKNCFRYEYSRKWWRS